MWQPLGRYFKWRISVFTLEVRWYSYWLRFALCRTVVDLHVHFYKVSRAFITTLRAGVSVCCLLLICSPPKAKAGFGWTHESKKQSPDSHPSSAGVEGWSVIARPVYQKTWNKKHKMTSINVCGDKCMSLELFLEEVWMVCKCISNHKPDSWGSLKHLKEKSLTKCIFSAIKFKMHLRC